MREIHIDLGRRVICDECNKEWTDSEKSGGILFGSHAVCPDCEHRMLKYIKQYKEEFYIKGTCPKGTSFADWIRSLRKATS